MLGWQSLIRLGNQVKVAWLLFKTWARLSCASVAYYVEANAGAEIKRRVGELQLRGFAPLPFSFSLTCVSSLSCCAVERVVGRRKWPTQQLARTRTTCTWTPISRIRISLQFSIYKCLCSPLAPTGTVDLNNVCVCVYISLGVVTIAGRVSYHFAAE